MEEDSDAAEADELRELVAVEHVVVRLIKLANEQGDESVAPLCPRFRASLLCVPLRLSCDCVRAARAVMKPKCLGAQKLLQLAVGLQFPHELLSVDQPRPVDIDAVEESQRLLRPWQRRIRSHRSLGEPPSRAV
ncbi:hypothetical protein OAO87_02005 [bacterium]|nr:hypothetical protein [bacterium]